MPIPEKDISSVLVALDSTTKSSEIRFSASIFLNINSAIGERHILPWQTNIIFFIRYLRKFLLSISAFFILIIIANFGTVRKRLLTWICDRCKINQIATGTENEATGIY